MGEEVRLGVYFLIMGWDRMRYFMLWWANGMMVCVYRKKELLRLTRDKRVRWARSFGMMGPGGMGMGPAI